MLIPLVQTAKNVEDEVPVRYRAVKIAKRVRQSLHLVALLSHREITLDKVAKHGVEVKGVCLAIADELVFKHQPGLTRGDATFPGDVLKVDVEGAEDPGDDDVVHPFRGRIIGRRSVEEDMGVEFVALEGEHHLIVPAGVVHRRGVQNNANHVADFLYPACLGMQVGDDGRLISDGWGGGAAADAEDEGTCCAVAATLASRAAATACFFSRRRAMARTHARAAVASFSAAWRAASLSSMSF
jgi:hypothetical protein